MTNEMTDGYRGKFIKCKEPGLENLPNEPIKQTSKNVIKELTTCFNKILKIQITPN